MYSRVLRQAILRQLAFPILLAGLICPATGIAGELRIGGTGNALGTMRLLGDAYAKSRPDTKVTVLPSIGTSGAIKAAAKAGIEIGLSSRQLTAEESGTGLISVEYASSPTVFAVHVNNKTTTISRQQIADVYAGKMTAWSDGTTIRPILRQPGDDNTRQIKELSPEIEKSLAIAEQRQGMAFAVTDQEAADKIESIQGGIGVTTVALILSEKRNLRALAIDNVEPTPQNAVSKRYPILKRFYMILPKDVPPSTQDFVAFVKSPAGKKILEQNGHAIP